MIYITLLQLLISKIIIMSAKAKSSNCLLQVNSLHLHFIIFDESNVLHYLCTSLSLMNQTYFRALWINLIGLIGLVVVTSLCGMVVYAQYRNCDPLLKGRITGRDQVRTKLMSKSRWEHIYITLPVLCSIVFLEPNGCEMQPTK